MTKTDLRVNPGRTEVLGLPNVAAFHELVLAVRDRPAHLPGWGVFYGRSGLGKTTAAVRATVTLECIHLECGSTWNSRTLVDNILHELAVHDLKGSVPTKVEKIIRILSDGPRVLIFDEADYLVKKSLVDVVREIYDKTGSPIILIGEGDIATKLAAFERAHNRVLKWTRAEPCTLQDAKMLAATFADGIVIADDLLKHFVAQMQGVTRYLVSNLEAVRQKCKREALLHIDLAGWKDEETYVGYPSQKGRGK